MSNISPRPEQSTEIEIDYLTALSNLGISGEGFAIAKTASGFINVSVGGTETDPIWNADKVSYSTKAQADLLYSAIGHTHSYQPLDQDLTDIAALSANGVLMKTAGVWGMNDYLNQAVKTTSSPTFANLNLTTDNAKINFGTGTDAFIRYTGTNWEFGLNTATTAIIFNSTGRDVDFKVGGSSGYIFTGDAALNSLTTGLSYVYGNYALSGGYSSTVGTSGYAGIAYGQETRVNQGKGAAFNMGTLVDGEYGTSHGYYTRGQGRGYFTAGYNTDANTVSFLAGDGTDNAGYGQIVLGYASGGGGSILTLSLGDAGQRYEVNDVLDIAGGSGGTCTVTGANALGDYAVTGVTLNAGGTGYVASETPTITGGNYDATVTIDSVDTGSGAVTGINSSPTYGGSGYSGSEDLTITSGNNDAHVNVDSTDGYGTVTGVSLTQAGTGYSVGAGLSTSGGGNNDCTVEVTSVDTGTGAITGITLLAGGTGYSVGTGVALSGGSGSLGTVDITSVNAGGEITSISLTDAGTGYSVTTGAATSYAGAGTGATVDITSASSLGRMIAQKTGSFIGGQDLQAMTNPNIIMFGKGFAETTEKSFNVGFDGRDFQITANNAKFGSGKAGADFVLTFDGESNDGVLTWMEDENYFKFSNTILSDVATKHLFRDTAIGIYSQADTFLDLYADGAVRIGNSSAGAPTTYLAIAPGADTFWVGEGSGLPYGSFTSADTDVNWTQTSAAQNTWYDISDTGFADGQLNLVTHDGSGKLTVSKAGRYLINYTLVAEGSAANLHIETAISVSGTESTNGIGHGHFVTANAETELNGTAILDLTANATINLSIRTTDAGTPNLKVEMADLTLIQIGGT